jgi:hypothetical protein
MADRTLYYFAIGGTGALSVEPLLHLCAAGLGPERLAVTLIEPDAGSPALGRAITLVESYERVREAFSRPATGFFRTQLIRTQRKDSVWSPLGPQGAGTGDYTLESYVQRTKMEDESRDALHLFELLFSPAQQREKLKEGFRGNPAIGSVMMHELRDATLFRELLSGAKNDAEARFFATGSIFGGTGASALPVLAKLLSDAGIAGDRLGTALVTPYYALSVPSADEGRDGRLKPDSAKFLSATAAALPTYTGGHTKYGSLYVMGDEQSLSQPRKTYSAGGPNQLNDPHFIELFAALAALDFADRPREGMLYAAVSDAEPGWRDLPLDEARRRGLRAFFLAANFFLQYYGATRGAAEEQRLESQMQKMPWLQDVALTPDFVRAHARALNELGAYFEAVWGWLWAAAHNYRKLRLVSFEVGSGKTVRVPDSYASREEGPVRLPIVEDMLHGFNARRKRTIFGRGDADRLESLESMFSWYNRVRRQDLKGMPGFLQRMREGSEAFVDEWYTPEGS